MLEEETDEGYRHAVWVMTMKLFADMERRRSAIIQIAKTIYKHEIRVFVAINNFFYCT